MDLSACMCLSLCTSVFAAESNMQSQIEIEIQAEKERVFSEVYRQLEIQNAVSHMSIYEEILGPEIEMSVLAKHGIGTYNANYSAPYGGVVTYTKYNCDVSITYLDYNNSGSTPILVDKGQKGRGTASCNLPATRYIIEANPLNVLKPRAFRFAACIMELIPSQTAFVMRW